MNNRNLLTPTNNDIKRGFGRSDQWKELLNVTKPLYYMNAKVMSKICARKTQQDAYTRQMMLFQQMRAVPYMYLRQVTATYYQIYGN
jgi:hypothetical protein